MKKIFIIISLIFLITGCSNINDLTYDEIIQNFGTVSSRTNIYRTGYKYYLPRGMQVNDSTLFNEILEDGKNTYYLYVDAVSYLNNGDYDYKINPSSVYSTNVENGEKLGHVEINLIENDKYLVEIIYNYAKIEVIVDEGDINNVMLSAISILKSIVYNDSVITNLLEDNVLNFAEEEFDMFDNNSNEDDYIDVGTDNFEPVEEEIPDSDLLN